jgi:hypothetical protein
LVFTTLCFTGYLSSLQALFSQRSDKKLVAVYSKGSAATSDVIQLSRGKVNTIIEHDDINLWDMVMRRFCCWHLFFGDLYRLGFCVTAVSRPTAKYPGYFGFSLGFNTPSLDSRMCRF